MLRESSEKISASSRGASSMAHALLPLPLGPKIAMSVISFMGVIIGDFVRGGICFGAFAMMAQKASAEMIEARARLGGRICK